MASYDVVEPHSRLIHDYSRRLLLIGTTEKTIRDLPTSMVASRFSNTVPTALKAFTMEVYALFASGSSAQLQR